MSGLKALPGAVLAVESSSLRYGDNISSENIVAMPENAVTMSDLKVTLLAEVHVVEISACRNGDNFMSEESVAMPEDSVAMSETTATLQGALRRSEKDEGLQVVKTVESSACRNGDNFMSEITVASVTALLSDSAELQVSLFLKRLPRSSTHCTLFSCEAAFLNEAVAYTVVVPRLEMVLGSPLALPNCYHASGQLLVLEDLHSLGYSMADKTRGLDLYHMRLVVQELARLHGASMRLCCEDPDGLHNLRGQLTDLAAVQFSEPPMQRMLDVAMATAADKLDALGVWPEVAAMLRSLEGTASQMLLKLSGPSGGWGAICHGDCWCNNVLFGAEGVPRGSGAVRLVDLQAMRFMSPAADLLTLLFTSSRPGLDHCSLLTHYHAILRTFCPLAPSLPSLHAHLAERRLYGLIVGIWYLGGIALKPADFPKPESLREEELFSSEFAELFMKSTVYEERLLDSVKRYHALACS